MTTTVEARQFYVIPLSVQKEEDVYVVGNPELGDFYQFPEEGVQILDMLRSGHTLPTIKSVLAAEGTETVDVDGFIEQLASIGFICPEEQSHRVQQRLQAMGLDTRRIFNIDPKIAQAVFSRPMRLCYLAIVAYAVISTVISPALRLNLNAFYTADNRTLLLLSVFTLSLAKVALHELGHMLAAARYGIKSRYGIGNRLWNIVAEADITGILTLPKSQRYFPMMAGLLVDVLCIALLTIVIQILLRYGAGGFAIQLAQAFELEVVLSMVWQFNVFVKTDIYYVLCNYFSYPDLDKDAQHYLRRLLHRVTLGRFGHATDALAVRNLSVIRAFSAIWLFGRILSFLALVCVFLPTIGRYIISIISLLQGPPVSLWIVCDNILYVSITLIFVSAGVYMWLTNMISSNGKEAIPNG